MRLLARPILEGRNVEKVRLELEMRYIDIREVLDMMFESEMLAKC